MEFISNLKIKTRLFFTMIAVSLILLGLTFYTSEKIRMAVRSQIPLQSKSTLTSEAGKISAIMENNVYLAKYIAVAVIQDV